MAASLDAFGVGLREKVKDSKILVVGAGGIGCELLKNVVLTGFKNIEIIDLDTIDVSNLNRQFLFQKQHVGKSKAMVARDGVLKLNPSAKIVAHHGSIMSPEFGPDYFTQFDVVLNALDNRNARNHVNRMCLAADIPLVESGSAGYLGQVTLIKKGLTECYECQPKAPQKSYPGCTIRNTPSEPIHCIVWAKHLFNQLFGEADPDEDVSPDTADPEAVGDAGSNALGNKANEAGNVERVSTRAWAISSGYDTVKLIHKLFHDDIKYLLSMDGLWRKRRPPTPLDIKNMPDAVAGTSRDDVDAAGIRDQRIWSIRECADVLSKAVGQLKARQDCSGDEYLVWDKDDEPSMDFVTACANIRSHVFGIQQKSRFDVKSMAGNIIPAIATTNAIIAGLIVMEALKVLQGRFYDCRTVYLNKHPNHKGLLLVPCKLTKPNPKCYVCSPKPQVLVKLDTETFTIGNLENKVLKAHLNMVAPDVVIDDGKGTILISSEEGETEVNNDRLLSEFGIRNGTQLKCDDFLQNYELVVTIAQCTAESLPDGQDFEVVADMDQLDASRSVDKAANGESSKNHNNDKEDSVSDATKMDGDGEDLIVIEEQQEVEENKTAKRSPTKKRNMSGNFADKHVPIKKFKTGADGDDCIIIL